MSCGDHHDTDCAEVLERVYVFIDRELGDGSRVTYEHIEQHLHECGPCLHEYDIERIVKALLARSCGFEHASAELRARVLRRLEEIRGQLVAD